MSKDGVSAERAQELARDKAEVLVRVAETGGYVRCTIQAVNDTAIVRPVWATSKGANTAVAFDRIREVTA